MYINLTEEDTYETYIQRIIDSRPNIKDVNEYQEHHHILPKCLGGTDDSNNLIWLYAQEHYYAHKLLALQYPNNNELQYAWWMMSQYNKYTITADEYEEARKRFSEIHSNREVKDSTREKLSKLHKGKHLGSEHWGYGKHRSEATKQKISESRKGKYTREQNAHAKAIKCNETGQVFNTMTEAAEAFGVAITTLSNHCRGQLKKIHNQYTFTIINN